MNRGRFFVSLLTFLCAISVLLTSCSKGHNFEFSNGKYVDEKTSISYLAAPGCYAPISVGDKLYGKIGDAELYNMGSADPQKWLCEKNGTVFYADTEILPTVDKMDVSQVDILLEDVSLVMLYPNNDTVSLIIDKYLGGESVARPFWTNESYEINWRIRFTDETRGIYYTFAYFAVKEDYILQNSDGTTENLGRAFFYNRFEDRLVPAGDVLHSYVEEFLELDES